MDSNQHTFLMILGLLSYNIRATSVGKLRTFSVILAYYVPNGLFKTYFIQQSVKKIKLTLLLIKCERNIKSAEYEYSVTSCIKKIRPLNEEHTKTQTYVLFCRKPSMKVP